MKKSLFALLFCMFLFNIGRAAVVITDPSPDFTKSLGTTSESDFFSIDFNHDGIEEYNFTYFFGRFGSTLTCSGPLDMLVYTSGSTWSKEVVANDSGITIDNTLAWTESSDYPEMNTNFKDLGQKYIAVKFLLGSATHYGWIHVKFATSATSGFTYTIYRYGYETTPNTPIIAGAPASPKADFTSTATATDILTPQTFYDASFSTPTSWEWTFTPGTVTFMGGTSASSQNPQVKFNVNGLYTVKLKASNAVGSDSVTKTDYMTVATAPIADFTSGVVIADTKTAIGFTDMSSNVPTSWEWIVTPATVSFVSVTTPASQDPVILFNVAGKYTVKLKVANSAGTDSITKTDYITIYNTPKADFKASTVSTDTKTTVNFTDLSTDNPARWEWTFSPATVTYMGGTNSASQHPQIKFDADGKYTVTLKATNPAGSNSMKKDNYVTVTTKLSITNLNGSTSERIRIYPNPAIKVLLIEHAAKEGTINIMDLAGKSELMQQLTDKKTQLDVSHLPKGCHLVYITTPEGVQTEKLTIE